MGCFLFTVTEGNKRPSGRRAERHVIKKWIGLQTKKRAFRKECFLFVVLPGIEPGSKV